MALQKVLLFLQSPLLHQGGHVLQLQGQVILHQLFLTISLAQVLLPQKASHILPRLLHHQSLWAGVYRLAGDGGPALGGAGGQEYGGIIHRQGLHSVRTPAVQPGTHPPEALCHLGLGGVTWQAEGTQPVQQGFIRLHRV